MPFCPGLYDSTAFFISAIAPSTPMLSLPVAGYVHGTTSQSLPILEVSAVKSPMVIVDEKQCGFPSRQGRSVPPLLRPRSVGWVPGVFFTISACTSGSAFANADACCGDSKKEDSSGASAVAIARRERWCAASLIAGAGAPSRRCLPPQRDRDKREMFLNAFTIILSRHTAQRLDQLN